MTDALTIRPARAEDAARVLAINASATPGVTLLTREELKEIAEAATLYLVAEDGADVVAYLVAVGADVDFETDEFQWFRSRYDQPFLYIDQVAVARARRSEGIGRRLYGEVEAWCRERGIPRLTCEVNLSPPNPGSARFHDRLGYTQVGTLETSDGRVVSLRAKALDRV